MTHQPEKHFFDLKLPLGGLLAGYGLLLILYGLFSGSELYEKSLGININLIWGVLMLIVGGLFLGTFWLKRSRTS
jgi:hypothetical protein